MVLPPIETTPVLVIRFSAKASSSRNTRLIELIEQRFTQGGLLILSRRHDSSSSSSSSNNQVVLYLTTTQQNLEETAERIHLMKITNDTKTIEYFTVKDRLRFSAKPQKQQQQQQQSVTHTGGFHNVSASAAAARTNEDPQQDNNKRDEHGIFTSHEWALLVRRILDNVTVLPSNQKTSELSQILDQDYRADYHVRSYDDHKNNAHGGSIRELTNSFRKTLREHGAQSACLRHVLQTYDIVDRVAITHLPKVRQDILWQTWRPWYRLEPPVTDIHNYYGWEISFYFAWMGFLTQWLLFPGILGLFFFLLRWYRHDTIDEDEYTPFYGLITFIWAVLFLRFWERHEHRLAYQWGTFSLSPYERQKFFAIRPQFRGYLRKSPVTGLIETYYPPLRRRLKYAVSAIATGAMLLVAFTVMILSLNLQGYIQPHKNATRWHSGNPHPFHFRSLAVYAGEGQIFDAQSSWRCMIPVVLHAICIFTLNSIYRVVAEALTSWENHETGANHRNSLILKRFLFEAFDCYVALFYLAFYERDVGRLRCELVAVFQIDTLRRILIECIVPMLLQLITHSRTKEARGRMQRARSSFKTIAPTDDTVMEDLDKDEYEQFDDYMEIVIQLGYVTLFASAYPLASLISIVANFVEIRSDCWKLTNVCRRPGSFRSSGLGMWRNLIASVIWTSALTNCLIAGFTSAQLTHYLPQFYSRDEVGFVNIGNDDGWLVVFVIFGLERLLLFIGALIFAIVPAVPEDVADELERRQYVRLAQEGDLPTPGKKEN